MTDEGWRQFSEAVFCEAAYRHFKNLALANWTRPMPRGQLFLNKLEGLLAEMVEQSSKPLVEIFSQ